MNFLKRLVFFAGKSDSEEKKTPISSEPSEIDPKIREFNEAVIRARALTYRKDLPIPSAEKVASFIKNSHKN